MVEKKCFFIKDVILMENVFYLGGNLFIKLMKMLVVPLVFFSIIVGVASISDIKKILLHYLLLKLEYINKMRERMISIIEILKK